MSTDRHTAEPGEAVTVDDLHATVTRRLRHDGQRYTTQRRQLVEVLRTTEAPLTVPQLLDRAHGLAQASAYRNLGVLERAGVVNRIVATVDHARWELAEDLTEHHHHLICNGCGDIADFTVPSDLEAHLDAALADAASEVGFDARHHRLDLVGLCARCQ
jgi:Fur family transcriptional regulator, ferric uptake regulator